MNHYFRVITVILSFLAAGQMSFAATAKSATKLKEAKKAERSIFGVISSENTLKAEKSTEGAAGENQVGLKVKISDTSDIQFRHVFISDYKKKTNTTADFMIRYSKGDLTSINDTNIWSQFRLYLPTSEGSIFVGKYQLRSYLGFEQKLSSNFSVNYLNRTRAYLYTIDEQGQTASDFLWMADSSYKVNKYLNGVLSIGYLHGYTHKGTKALPDAPQFSWKSQEYNTDLFVMDLGINLNFQNGISLKTYAEQVRLTNAKTPFSLMPSDETTYFLELGITI